MNSMGERVTNGVGDWVADGLAQGMHHPLGKGMGNSLGKGMADSLGEGMGHGLCEGMANSLDKGMSQCLGERMGHGVNNPLGKGVGHCLDERGVGDHRVGDSRSHRNSGGHSLGVDCLPRVGNLGHVTLHIIGVVVDGLGAAIREVDSVGSADHPCSIVRLGLAEGSLCLAVSNTIFEGVRGDLIRIDCFLLNTGCPHHDRRTNQMVSHQAMSNMSVSNQDLRCCRCSCQEQGDAECDLKY